MLEKHFKRLYNKLFSMEETKYLPPKFSYACKDMAHYYGVFEKKMPMSNFSTTSSEKSIV